MAKKKSPWHGKGKNRWRYVRLKKPPPGSYDIALDQNLRASQRGLKDLIADIGPKLGTQSTRALADFTLAGTEDKRQRGYLAQDYATNVGLVKRDYGRTMEDLLSQENTLKRNYGQLANAQRQNFQASGLSEGGAAQQAAQKRAANYQFEQAPIQVARTRATQDQTSSLDDLLRQNQRATQDLNTQLGQTGLTYGRGVQDRATQLTIARREADKYRQDIAATKMQQYTQGGGKTRRRVGVKQYRKLRKRGAI